MPHPVKNHDLRFFGDLPIRHWWATESFLFGMIRKLTIWHETKKGDIARSLWSFSWNGNHEFPFTCPTCGMRLGRGETPDAASEPKSGQH
jgi:hypothetical protein